MNNAWIYCSKAVIDDHRGFLLCDHERWLDTLNLHEISWMLFATINDRDGGFGWPGRKHE